MFQMPNANLLANPLSTQQRFMTQAGYVNLAMTINYQPSANLEPVNANNGWTGQESNRVICKLVFRTRHRQFNR